MEVSQAFDGFFFLTISMWEIFRVKNMEAVEKRVGEFFFFVGSMCCERRG